MFIYPDGNLSFDTKYLTNFNTLLKNKKAFTKQLNIFYDHIYQIECTVFFCNFDIKNNICFKEFNGPILLYNSTGFSIEDLNYMKKRCNIAKGKLFSQYM